MLIDGNLIPEDLELARSFLSESSIVDEPETSLLLGKIEYKKSNFEIAKDYYVKASKKGNGESMFLYASMLMKGEGVDVDNDEALRYFTLQLKMDTMKNLFKQKFHNNNNNQCHNQNHQNNNNQKK